MLIASDNYAAAASWVKGRIEAAIAEDPNKPIFVFFHHPIRYTFYVSEEWYGSGLNNVFNNYPQVVTFSGHIHSPNNDPRSIWQDGGFTAVNTVTTYYYEMESGYVGDNANATGNRTIPMDSRAAIQGLLVTANGTSVEIRNYDFVAGMFIDQTWTFDVTQPLPYTNARAEKAQKPIFNGIDKDEVKGKVELTDFTNSGVVATFKQAYLPEPSEVGEMIHSYRFDFINRETGQVVRTFKQWSDFMHEPMQPTYSQNIGGLSYGMPYELRIYAFGSFQKISDQYLSVNFTAGLWIDEDPADKARLDELIEEAYLLDESFYTDKSWTRLSAALFGAVAVSADKYSNQDEIDIAAANLAKAMELLVVPVVAVVPNAAVTKTNGETNILSVSVIEVFADGSEMRYEEVFTIMNNAADIYEVGGYVIYVKTNGNTQIRACYIL
jgi:hypothetical protein